MTDLGYSIPMDLIIEILLKSPAKSVLRFRSVSKSWCSVISSQQFINAFMALSLSRPRLALLLKNSDDDQAVFLFSAHQSCSFMSSSSMAVTEKNTLTMPEFEKTMLITEKKTMPEFKTRGPVEYICNYSVRGFICCRLRDWFVVCNPSTGQVIRLAGKYYDNYKYCRMYLGYDPNNDEYKVLRIMCPRPCLPIEHSVCTLGGQGSSHSWRPINKAYISSFYDCPNGVYIDGVVYYYYQYNNLIVVTSFDVGSEQLSLIVTHEDFRGGRENYLTNYLGKLAIYCSNENKFVLWVRDDVKNEVWSKKIHVVPSLSGSLSFCFAGITTAGEIFYVPWLHSDSFELLSYDVEKKMERRVRVEGLSGVNCYDKPTAGEMTWATLLCPYVESIIYFSGN